MRALNIFILCIGLVVLACNKKAGVGDDCESGCKPNQACTYDFRSAIVQVADGAGTGVQLDSFVVLRAGDQKIVINNRQSHLAQPNQGKYLLFSDLEINETSRCGEDFEFRGYKNDRLVAGRTYRIAHDCCHINLVSGDTKIVIEE